MSDFTVKMLGSRDGVHIKVKGAECWGIPLSLLDEIRRTMPRLGTLGPPLLEAGELLERMTGIFKGAGIVVPDADRVLCGELWRRHVHLLSTHFPQAPTPKHHLFWHLLRNVQYMAGRRLDYGAQAGLKTDFATHVRTICPGAHAEAFAMYYC